MQGAACSVDAGTRSAATYRLSRRKRGHFAIFRLLGGGCSIISSMEMEEHAFRLLDWAADYDAYMHLVADRAVLADVLRPLREPIEIGVEVPKWAGPDLIRALAFSIFDAFYQPDEDEVFSPAAVIRQLGPLAHAYNKHPAATADRRFNPHRLLQWVLVPAWWWWVAEVGDGADTSEFGDSTRYRIFSHGNVFELWIWVGPPERIGVLGMHGADLRSQKRAKHLSTHRTLGAAKRAGDKDRKKRMESEWGRLH